MTLLLHQEVYMFLTLSSTLSTLTTYNPFIMVLAILIALLLNEWLNTLDLGFGRACFAYVFPSIVVAQCAHGLPRLT